MNTKKRLLDLFTEDTSYNFHLIRTENPNGHLIYLAKNGTKLKTDTLEFSPTTIIEELIKKCSVQFEKFAPAIFFTEEFDTNMLKEKLNNKFFETPEFSKFIEKIKNKYKILEIKDSLEYKKDPEAYTKAKREEAISHQKELIGDLIEQMNERKKKREETLLAYNNDLFKLLKEYLENKVEYEKRDFDIDSELGTLFDSLIDPETWIKNDYKPFVYKIKICSLETDKVNVFLTNNINSYTATLRFDKTVLITENVIKIDESPEIMSDYEILAKLYDVDIISVNEWEFKNNTEKFEYVIDYLVPIFKENKAKREKEFVESVLKEESKNLIIK
jgi:hypothetical protein